MGKGERERGKKRGREERYTALQLGSKIPQSVLAEQIETITVRGIFSFGIFSPPLRLICHEVHECSDQSERQGGQRGMSEASWILLESINYMCEERIVTNNKIITTS